MRKINTAKEIIRMLSSFPQIEFCGEVAFYCPELKLAYIPESGYLIRKIDQCFHSLDGYVKNNQANKILVKNGLECQESDMNISERELLEILEELKPLYVKLHVLQ